MSTLGSSKVTRHDTHIPQYGSIRADVWLDGGDLPSGKTVLTIGTLELVVTVQRALFDMPDKPHAVVVSGIGWDSLVTAPISFQSDGGVRLSTALDAIAAGAGETIEQPKDSTIGNYFEVIASRPGEPVRWSDALAELVRGGHVASWRVDPDGVTRFGPRAAKAVTGRATQLGRDGSASMRTYGIDDPAQFLPGNTIDGFTIAKTVIRERSEKLVLDAYSSDDAASISDLIRRIVGSVARDRPRTYVIAAVHGDGRVDLSPPPDAQHLPEMRNVEQWVSAVQLVPGAEVMVMFGDDRRTRPRVFAVKPGPGPFKPVARLGDQVTVFAPPTMPVTGTVSGAPFVGVITMAGAFIGTIQTGSTKKGAE